MIAILRRHASRLQLVAALVLAAVVPASAQTADSVQYDIVIRNGRVLDGAGNPWILADVAIRDGRFAAIGTVRGRGAREIDAHGRYVSPGWIDMMDQSGGMLLRNGLAETKLFMGVTTAVGGEGGPPVPVDSMPGYFARLEEQGISMNFGTFVSHGQARGPVIGGRSQPPTADELERMKVIMDRAMRAGALGMSTALIYPPMSYTTTEELIATARVAAMHGGVYASHIRGEGKELLESVAEAIEIGEKAGLPVEIFHLKAAYQPGWGTLMTKAGALIDSARARGVDVAADLYPYTAGGTGLDATIPSWAHEGGRDSLRARLTDPATRARLKREVTTGSPGWWNIIEAAGGWDGVVLAGARNPEYTRFEGKSIPDIARALGKEPVDAAWDLVLEGRGRVTALYHMMSEADIETALRFPWTSIGSDAAAAATVGGVDALGLPHPRSYGTFPRVIARYVQERGVLTLPEAIRKMTSWPATRMRLSDRGVIREGVWADVVIFDLDRLADRATWEAPTTSPEGIDYVLVNGRIVVEAGRHTGERPGKVLYGPGRRSPGG
jgi:N-acyl-D-aspartate/D-glutamate deacylase